MGKYPTTPPSLLDSPTLTTIPIKYDTIESALLDILLSCPCSLVHSRGRQADTRRFHPAVGISTYLT